MRPGVGTRWGVRDTCYLCCRSCSVFVVSKPRWPRSIVKERCRPRSISESNVSECVRLCDTHIPAMPGLYLWYVTSFRVTFLSVTHHVRTYVRTYVHTYFVRIDPRFRALALMCSAIITTHPRLLYLLLWNGNKHTITSGLTTNVYTEFIPTQMAIPAVENAFLL